LVHLSLACHKLADHSSFCDYMDILGKEGRAHNSQNVGTSWLSGSISQEILSIVKVMWVELLNTWGGRTCNIRFC
jgi:hypothetical protein